METNQQNMLFSPRNHDSTLQPFFLPSVDNDTNQNKCKKNIMENELRIGFPLVDCLKDLQNPDNIVPAWTNGGDDTR